MKNQFFYTIEGTEDKVYHGSFNPEYVVRSAEYEPGKLVVLLNDFHERTVDEPKREKSGKITTQKVRKTINSEIFLSAEDSIRFKAAFEMEPLTVALSKPEEVVKAPAEQESVAAE